MKKMLVGLIALAVALVGAPALAQHDPYDSAAECPPDVLAVGIVPFPTFNLIAEGAPFDDPPSSWPAVGSYDFCGYADQVFCMLNAAGGLAEELPTYAALFQCLTMDINGPINEEAEIPVTGNGIPDGAYELALLGAVMNDPDEPLHAEALAAYQYNFIVLKALVGTALQQANYLSYTALVPMVAPGLIAILAGYPTLGDAQTNQALDALLTLLSDLGLEPPAGGIVSITHSVPQLGPEGDADGDGASNRKEYNYFKSQGPAATIAAQLDPTQTPPNLAFITGAGKFEEGANVTLRIGFNGISGAGSTYQWFKGGSPIADATASSLAFSPVAMSDSGSYSCEVNIPDKATVFLTDPAVLTILPAGSLPVAGGMGLALLAGACALAGAVGIRRRK
ncbi:MAG TPA: immunoglobulin domain-containing protein [Candidatus Hydrogenedentes bacterium]|nr:immunoglobulin domain-containing protein [Candidatus Hydrogenedentota bacterium]HOH49319.1 immunoglobulin domain-containing protein [Candidatus Hydrogenedentota bacterium]